MPAAFSTAHTAVSPPNEQTTGSAGGFDSEVKVWDANSLAVVSSFSLGARVYAASMSTAATSHCLVAVGSGDTKV